MSFVMESCMVSVKIVVGHLFFLVLFCLVCFLLNLGIYLIILVSGVGFV